MKISYNWLKDLLEFDLNVEETSKLLTDIGLEVEKTKFLHAELKNRKTPQ